MPTIGNLPGADVEVTFPSGTTKTVNMIRLLVHVQNAEFKAKHGMFLPGVNKLRPTVKAMRAEYELPANLCKTWDDVAKMLRGFYKDLQAHIEMQRAVQRSKNTRN
jgi:iron-sulfur cluster repair protein YtfE (RIC family)